MKEQSAFKSTFLAILAAALVICVVAWMISAFNQEQASKDEIAKAQDELVQKSKEWERMAKSVRQ